MKTTLFNSLLVTIILTLFSALPLQAQRGGSHLEANLQRHIEQRISQYSPQEQAALINALWQMVLAEDTPCALPYVCERAPKAPAGGKACNDCGSVQAIPADPCQGLKDAYKEATEDWATYDLIGRLLTDLQTYNGQIAFASGLADLISNGVTAYTFVTTLGTGTVISKVATKKIKQMAIGSLKASVNERMAGLLPPPYDQMVQGDLSGAALSQMIANAQKAKAAAQKRKSDLIAKINACTQQYNATKAAIHSQNEQIKKCQEANAAYCGD
ncbi:MAG: hypothetical protein AAFN10_00535 [Bacteroidota bacterium]